MLVGSVPVGLSEAPQPVDGHRVVPGSVGVVEQRVEVLVVAHGRHAEPLPDGALLLAGRGPPAGGEGEHGAVLVREPRHRLAAARAVALAFRTAHPSTVRGRGVSIDAIDALADGLVTALTLLDPRTLIIGGGLAEAGETLFTPLRAAVEERVTFQKLPSIVPAALGDTAGCLGAGLLAWDLLSTEVSA